MLPTPKQTRKLIFQTQHQLNTAYLDSKDNAHTPDLHATWILLDSAHQQQQQRLLHVLMTVDLWCD